MTQNLIVSSVFFLYAIVAIAKPDWLGRWQTWSNRKILGATFKPSQRTYTFYRIMGVIFLLFATALFVGIIE